VSTPAHHRPAQRLRDAAVRGAIPKWLSVLIAVALATPAQAQTVPLIALEEAGEVSFWWSSPDGAPTALDEALLATDLGWVTPRPAGTAGLSSLYRRPDLNPRNARLLASELGASSLLLGRATAGPVRPVAGELVWVAEVRVEAVWLAVADESRERRAEVSATGQGRDRESARRAAIETAAEAVYAELSGVAPAAGGGTTTTPSATGRPALPPDGLTNVLVVRGLERAAALVAFKGDLRLREAVVEDVWEAWATEGAIGLQVALRPGASWPDVRAVVAELASTATAYRLEVTGAGDARMELELSEIEIR
jgi:hypothetical protein